MVKIAIWCRHIDDNIIAIENKLPWRIPSDVEKFRRIITGQNIIMGRKTYESLPKHDLPADKIFILTSNKNFEPFDKSRQTAVNSLKMFKDFEEDLYICGGAKVYEEFILSGSKLMPELIIDCVYHGSLDPSVSGTPIDITPCIKVLSKDYRQISIPYTKDDVTTTIFTKKGEFIDQAILKSLLQDIEQ